MLISRQKNFLSMLFKLKGKFREGYFHVIAVGLKSISSYQIFSDWDDYTKINLLKVFINFFEKIWKEVIDEFVTTHEFNKWVL